MPTQPAPPTEQPTRLAIEAEVASNLLLDLNVSLAPRPAAA